MGRALFAAPLLLVTPLLALVWRSVTTVDGSLTLAYYEALPAARAGRTAFIPPLQAVRNSMGYALLTMISAGTLGVLTATALAGRQERRWLDATFMLPLGASAVTLGFGYLITFSSAAHVAADGADCPYAGGAALCGPQLAAGAAGYSAKLARGGGRSGRRRAACGARSTCHHRASACWWGCVRLYREHGRVWRNELYCPAE